MTTEPEYIARGATFSPCKNYRYTLMRKWSALPFKSGYVLFLMLNPSIADELVLDPTVRRCLGYALDWNYSEMHVCNIFGIRGTDPRILREVDDPVGKENDKYICEEVGNADLVIAAWGSHGTYKNRGDEVMKMVSKIKPIHYLQLTKQGIPSHPLYLKGNLTPQVWDGNYNEGS